MTSDLSPRAPAHRTPPRRASRASAGRLGVRGILAAAWTLTGLLWSLLRGRACAQRLAHAESSLAMSILAAGLARLGLAPEAIGNFEAWLDWSGGDFALGVRRRADAAIATAGLPASGPGEAVDPPPSSVSHIALTRAVDGAPRIGVRVRVLGAASPDTSEPGTSRPDTSRPGSIAPRPCVAALALACPRPP